MGRSMTFRIAGLALVLCCLLALPAPAGAARGMEVAVQDDSLLLFRPGQYMGLNTAYRKLRAMKTSRTRMNLLWGYVVTASQRNLPTKPRTSSTTGPSTTAPSGRARRRGVKVQLTLTGPAPAWATPTRSVDTGYIKPNVRLFKKFVKKVAHRYRRKVDRFAIWNEPNWYKWLGPLRRAPRLYRKLYIAGYKAIKRKAPRARVLLGETSPNAQPGIAIAPLKFLRRMTCLNRHYRRKPGASRRCKHPLRADGVAHHPYDFDKSPRTKPKGRDDVTIAVLGRLNRALKKMKRRHVLIPRRTRKMPVHLTEYGYFSPGAARSPSGAARAGPSRRGRSRAGPRT